MQKETSLGELLEIVRRRKWYLIVPSVVFSVAALAISFFLPPKYTSDTLVLVEQPKVNDSIVKPAVEQDLDRRLSTMKEQILSRTRLQPIMQRFGLYKDQLKKKPMEELLDDMRKEIKITPIKGANNFTTGFYIEFSDRNAKAAQDVCAEITSLFMEQNLKAREERAVGTTEFLANQLEEAKHKLDQQDAKLATFKSEHLGAMPEQEQSNMNILMTTRSQLDAVTETLSRTRQDKAYVENLITQQEAAVKASHPMISGGTQAVEAVPSQDLEAQIRKMKADLSLLESRYTADYPEVVKSRSAIAEMEKQLADQRQAENKEQSEKKPVAAATAAPPRVEIQSPELQSLRNNLHTLDSTIADKVAEQDHLQKQIQAYEARVQASPKVEEEGKQLSRDYQQAYAFYQDLLGKKTQSEMLTDLERRQEGEQFRIMDPANLPERPSFPKPERFAAGGLAAGLFLGGVAIFIFESMGKAVRSVAEVEFYLKFPILVSIPDLKLDLEKDKKGWLAVQKLKFRDRRQHPDTSEAVGA